MFGGLGAKSFTELHSETKRGISTLSFAYEIFKRANFVPVISSRCTCRRQSPWYISTSPASPYARVLYEIRDECCKESAAVENADHAHRVGNPGALEDQDQGRGRVIASPLCQVVIAPQIAHKPQGEAPCLFQEHLNLQNHCQMCCCLCSSWSYSCRQPWDLHTKICWEKGCTLLPLRQYGTSQSQITTKLMINFFYAVW